MQRFFDRVSGLPAGELDPSEAYSDLRLPDGAGDRPYTLVNMVSTLDGKAVVGGPGTTWSLGTAVDHLLFKQLRRSCDAMITGAGVMIADDIPYPRLDALELARRERAGLRPQPLWIVVSGRAMVSPSLRVFKGGRENVLVVVTTVIPIEQREALEAVAQVLAIGETWIDMREMGQRLFRDRGIRRLYSIGGPTLNAAMLAAGTLDELFLTLTPKIQGGQNGATIVEGQGYGAGSLPEARLLSAYGAADELFLRYGLTPWALRPPVKDS